MNDYKLVILSEQTAQLYDALKSTLVALLINAGILVFILWPVIDKQVLLLWLAAVVIIAAGRGVTAYLYKIKDPHPDEVKIWFRYFLAGSVLTGLSWSAASIWLFPADNMTLQVFLAFVIGGVATGAVSSLSYTRATIYSYLALLLIPLLIRFLMSDSDLSLAMSGLLLLFVLVLVTAAKRNYVNFSHNIDLSIKSFDRENHIRQAEERYRTLLDTATDAFYLHDFKGRILDVNKQACLDLGYSRAELLSMAVVDFKIDADQQDLEEYWAQLKSNEHIKVESEHRRKDGSSLPVEINIGLVEIDDQKLISILARDITERKQIEKVIHDSQQRMALHVQNTPLGVIEWDQDFCVIDWNPSAEKIFGYTKEEAMGRSARELIIPENAARYVSDVWTKLLSSSGGLRSNNENLTKDGEIIKCEWYNTPLINDRHEVIGVASLVQDVTEQMNAIDTIHQSESNFRALFELSNQANMTLDKEKFLDCNNATLEIFGFSSKEEFMGKHPGELSPPVQPDGTASRIAADEKIAVAYKEGKNFFEWMHRRCNGEDFPAEVLLTPMKQDGKDVLQAVVVDITQRKKSEADLLEAIKSARQANQAKSEFLSRMSHELRTPLNSILGFCQLLDLKYEDPDVKSSVAEIHKAGTHLLDLINEILDLSKIEAGKLQLSIADYNFGLVLSDSLVLIELMATRSSIEIINETESYADCVIHVDYTRFKQVLINLLSNAVKYNNENGVVTISCEVVDDNRLRINIKDTGNGLTDKQQQALFKPFERLKEHNKIEGTGIGLVITRHLVENMGGEIGVDSYPGKGSTFWVEINLSESNKSDSIPIHVEVETEGSVVQGQQLLSDKTILYIEDTPANLKLVKLLIEEHTDYTMISAPEAGLGLVLAEEKQPDLILMDINLPGMSGFEAFSELQKNENTRDIPVVAISANAMQSDIEKGMSAGFEDYITKPVNVTALLTAINKFIKS